MITTLLPALVFGAIALFWTGGFALAAAGRTKGAPTRLAIAVLAAWALLGLVVSHRLIPWAIVPSWLWLVPVALTAAGAAASVLRWRALPVLPDRRGHRIGQGVQGGVVVALAAALALV